MLLTVVRALARLARMAWMLALALLGLGIALYCLEGATGFGRARPDRWAHLPVVRDHVGRFLAQVVAPGPPARLAVFGGAGVIALGLLLLLGTLRRRWARRSRPD